MINIRYKTGYILHNERNGSATVRIRVTMPGMRKIDYAIGRSIPSRDMWDTQRQRLTSRAPQAREANLLLSDIEAAVSSFFARMSLVEERLPSREEVLSALADATGRRTAAKAQPSSALSVFDRYVSAAGTDNEWTWDTYKKYRTLRNHLEEFAKEATMDGVDEAFLASFVHHLIHVRNLRNATVAKHIRLIRPFLKWAARNGLYSGNAHTTYRPRIKGAGSEHREVIYLTVDELRRVEEHVFTDPALDRVRDVFTFCCYTGLRFSDALKLRREDVHDGYIDVVTRKTRDRLHIELNRHSEAILNKWRDVPIPGGLALPVISNQRTNRHLKQIGRECGLEEPVRLVWYRGAERHEEVRPKRDVLTTHVARRTFVVTALQLGIPAEVIMRWTGHSDWSAMKPYVAIVDELKRKSMGRFDTI